MKINLRKIVIILILCICIIAINLVVFFKITEKDETNKENNNIDTTQLRENFEKIFDNKVDYQNNNVNILLKDTTKDIIYTSYYNTEELQESYKLNVCVPNFNIVNEEAENINREINNLFYQKALDILARKSKYTVYDVKYKAYINDNILSVVITAILKEGDTPQRKLVKTYNYDLSTNKQISLEQILKYRNLEKEYVQNKIYNDVKIEIDNANKYIELGYSKYLRNIEDSMYKIENAKIYFVGENKVIYIIYPYGNTNYTSEIDLIII